MPATARKPKAPASKNAPPAKPAKAVKTKAPAKTATATKPRTLAKAEPPAKAKPAAVPRSRRTAPKGGVPPDQRRHYVEVAAYFIAEQRGFLGGCEIEDWVLAESEIERMLKEGKLGL